MKINKKARMRVLSALTAAAMLFAAAPAFADGVEEEEAPAEEVVLVEEAAEEEEAEEAVLHGAEEGKVVSLMSTTQIGTSDVYYELTYTGHSTYYDEYTLTITGSGAMPDFDSNSDAPWYDYRTGITELNIESGVTTVGDHAFFSLNKITSLTLPSGITGIGKDAFQQCQALTSVTLPESVTSIGAEAFYNCSKLESITIPSGVTSIGSGAFRNCSSLATSITIPSGVTTIEAWTFCGCSGLTDVTISGNVTSIGMVAFQDCSSLTSITIPNSVTTMGYQAFNGCTGLTTVTIGSGLTSLSTNCFSECTSIATVYILQSATSNTIKTNLTNNLTSYFSSSPNVYFLAENVQLSLEPVYDSTPAQIPGQYTLTISGLDSAGDPGVIYRFMTAQMKLAFDANDGLGTDYDITKIGALSIEANTADDIAMIYQGNGEYGFYVDGTSTDCITSHEIELGDVTITGVGSYSLNVDTSYDNKAHSAYLADNIVQDFTYDSSATSTSGTGYLLLDNGTGGTIPATGEITLDMIDLTVNVMFPNEISSANTAYTAMSLTYDNVSLDEAATVAIGSDSTTSMSITDITADSGTWKGYSFTIEIPKGYTTSLVFAGDGYRTCNTSVTPDTTASAATVTVWNNVMSESQAVVAVDNTAASSAKVTFLAGDIVGDGEINLFDLSAVTSYFGKEIGESETNYIQYDLNRDGKIDSRDIAMVLVSWNN